MLTQFLRQWYIGKYIYYLPTLHIQIIKTQNILPEERSYRSTTPLAKASANWQIFRVLAIYVWEKGGTA